MDPYSGVGNILKSGVASLTNWDMGALLIGGVSSLVLIVVTWILRSIVARIIQRNERLSQELRRRWLVQVRNGAVVIILLGLVIIWANELRTVAVYVFAVAVATVIATKELIQCVTGSLMKTMTRSFDIGDRIEIGDFRGDVIDHNVLTTTVMEIGPDGMSHRLTGRSVTIPNSVFLSKAVINETFTDDYVLHVFAIPMKMEDDWEAAKDDLLKIAKQHSAAYIDEARRHFERLGKREGLYILSVEPHVTFSVPEAGDLHLVVRMAAPARQKGKIEQAILGSFLPRVKERRVAKSETPSSQSPPPA